MRYLYALAALALLITAPASAQTEEEQVDPAVLINMPADIATEIDNFTFEYPAPYTLPDTSASLLVGASLFTENNAGEVGIAPVYTEAGVNGDFVIALDGEENLSEGCGDNSADSPTIENDVAGKIVMVARGTCSFVFKTEIVQNLGGLGVIIYNPEDRDPDTIGNMIAPDDYAVELTIPTVLMVYSMAAPIVNALVDGQAVDGAIKAADVMVAVDDTPEASAAAFRVSGSNPFSNATSFKVTLPTPEAIQIEVYNVQGRRVASLHNGVMAAGETTVDFVAGDLPSGVYLVRATGEEFSMTRTVSVVR